MKCQDRMVRSTSTAHRCRRDRARSAAWTSAIPLVSLIVLTAACSSPARSVPEIATTVTAEAPTSAPATFLTTPSATTRTPSEAASTPPLPPSHEESSVGFVGAFDAPDTPATPEAKFLEAPGARVHISGGWEGTVLPDQVSCSTLDDPPWQPFVGWYYEGNDSDVVDALTVKLHAEYESPEPHTKRQPYDPSLVIGWEDENKVDWTAHASWAWNEPGPAVVVSPDRRSIRFTGRAVAQPAHGIGHVERTTWITFDGVLTCTDPMYDIG